MAAAVMALHKSCASGMNSSQCAEYERLDRLRTEGRIYAERRCRKLRKGQVPFSPALKKSAAKVEICKLLIRRHRGGRASSRKIQRLSNVCGVQGYKNLQFDELKVRLKTALKEYRFIKKTAPARRQTFLEELAAMRAAENKTKRLSLIHI